MRRLWLIIGAALVVQGPALQAAPPAGPSPQAAAAAPAPVPENALRLARVVAPQDRTLAAGLKAFRAGVELEMKNKPEEAAVFNDNPGLLDAIVEAGSVVMQKHLVAIIPLRQQRIATFYAEKFSPAEIDQLVTFYSSPTGAKFIDAMYAGTNFDKLLESMGPGFDKPISAEALQKFKLAAVADLPDQFDADDWKALFLFAASPIRAKLSQVEPEFQKLMAALENEPDPELDADISKSVETTVNAYMARKKAKPR